MGSSSDFNKKYMSKRQASAYTTMSQRMLDYARQRGELAFIKKSSRVIFKVADLDRWLGRSSVRT